MATDSIAPAASAPVSPPSTAAVVRQAYHGSAPTAAAQSTRAAEPPGVPPRMDDVRDAVRKIEAAVMPLSQDLRFSIDEDSGTPIIKLIDSRTDTVLRQIPTVEALEISKALEKLQGLLVREKA